MFDVQRLTGLAAAAVIGLGIVSTAGTAEAAITICDADTASKVTPLLSGVPTVADVGCQYDDAFTNDPTSTPLVPNLAGFFGITDWMFDYKFNFPDATASSEEGPNDLGYEFTAGSDTMEGGFTFSNLAIADKVLLLFKGPQNAEPNALVGYLLDVGALGTGTYESMFYKFNSDGTKTYQDISHVGTYYTAIPLPAAAWLLLGGLGGLGLMSRRRKAAAA